MQGQSRQMTLMSLLVDYGPSEAVERGSEMSKGRLVLWDLCYGIA